MLVHSYIVDTIVLLIVSSPIPLLFLYITLLFLEFKHLWKSVYTLPDHHSSAKTCKVC